MPEPHLGAELHQPASTAGAAAWTGIPSLSAARHTSDGSPDGSAAASCSSRRVWAAEHRSAAGSSPRSGPSSERAPGSPNPPASSAGVSPRGSSSNAKGLPRVSATIWSRIRASSGPVSAESSSARASPSRRPSTTAPATPPAPRPGPGPRRPGPPAPRRRRRATNARACAEARSSHCWSSTTQISGRSPATSDSKPSTARATRNRSGAGPALMPNAVRSASRCGTGSRPADLASAPQLVQPSERQLHLRLDTGRVRQLAPRRPPAR